MAEVQRGAKSVKFVLPKGENASATTTVAAPKDTPTSTTTTKKAESKDNFFEVEVLVKTADDKLVEGAEFKSEDGRVVGTTDANGRGRIGIDLKKNSRDNNLIQLALKEAPKGYKNTEVLIRRDEDKAELVLPRDPNATPSSTLSKPDQVLKVLDQVRPVASSFLAPAAALAGVGGLAGAGGSKSTKTTKTTFGGTSVTNTRRSTGRSTSVTPSAKVVTRSGNSTKVAKSTSTTRTTSSDERDGDLADTGTPMRAIIALGVLSVLIGGAYLALGRRRENQ